MAALKLFCEAAKQEAATAELVRRVERFLKRVEVDPEVRFCEGIAPIKDAHAS